MKKTTPSGTRTLLTSKPFGRRHDSMISPDRVAEHGDFFQRRRDALDPCGSQSQAVDLGVAQAESGRGREILGIGRQDVLAAFAKQTGGQLEPLVFLGSADHS